MRDDKRYILWLEDHHGQFGSVRRALNERGIAVNTCCSLAEADYALQKEAALYDLIVVDNLVPDERDIQGRDGIPADERGSHYLLDVAASDLAKSIVCPVVVLTFFAPPLEVYRALQAAYPNIHVLEKDQQSRKELVEQLTSYVVSGVAKETGRDEHV